MRWHEIEHRVMMHEVDSWGMAWHGNYIKWFERGRSELLRAFGLAVSDLDSLQVLAPVVKAECEYKNPARCDDLVIIRTVLAVPTVAMLTFQYEILRADDRLLLAKGETSQVLLSREGKMYYLIPPEVERRVKQVLEYLNIPPSEP